MCLIYLTWTVYPYLVNTVQGIPILVQGNQIRPSKLSYNILGNLDCGIVRFCCLSTSWIASKCLIKACSVNISKNPITIGSFNGRIKCFDSYDRRSPKAGSKSEVMFLSPADISTFKESSSPVIGWVPLAWELVGSVAFGQIPLKSTPVLSSTDAGSFNEPITNK